MKILRKYGLLAVYCTSAIFWSTEIAANNNFIVRDIKVNGLQRISVGTVLNYLPVQVGEAIGHESTAQIIRALYDTGFFQSVALERQNNTLIVQVVERSTIASILVTGNTEIPSDKMKTILQEFGLVQGHIFQRSALEHLEKELKHAGSQCPLSCYFRCASWILRLQRKITFRFFKKIFF